MTSTWLDYVHLMRWHRPIGFYLLLWPTLWAVWIAGQGQPDIGITAIFIAGVILMRSAGCVINDYADRDIDPLVQRTQDRPLARGRIQPKSALILFAVLCLFAFGLVLFLNWLTIQLSLIALVLAIVYPFTKRYTHFPQVVLGAAFAMAIPMAFSAQTNQLPLLAWGLFVIVVLWTVAYDTLYAMVDREDDIKIGVKSTAILFAKADKLMIGLLQLSVLGGLFWIGQHQQFGVMFYVSLLLASFLAMYQQWLIRDRQTTACFEAFLNNHWFGLVIFLGIFLGS